MKDYEINETRKQRLLDFYRAAGNDTEAAVKLALSWIEADPKLVRECLWRGAYDWMLLALNQERKAIINASVRALDEPDPLPSKAVEVLRGRHTYNPTLNNRATIENIFNTPMPKSGKLIGDCTKDDLGEEIAHLEGKARALTGTATAYRSIWEKMKPGKTVRESFTARELTPLMPRDRQ